MSRQRIAAVLSWGTCLVILLALLLGLDPYRRLRLEYGYGPERHRYFNATRERASELQREGAYRIRPEEKWPLRGGWEEELSDADSPEALAVHRRARLVLPVLVPEPLQIRLPLTPLPTLGEEVATIEVEYGVNGVEQGRFEVPPGGAVLKFRVEPPVLHRGDNILYLYRVTRRPDSSPWLAVGGINARVVRSGS